MEGAFMRSQVYCLVYRFLADVWQSDKLQPFISE